MICRRINPHHRHAVRQLVGSAPHYRGNDKVFKFIRHYISFLGYALINICNEDGDKVSA